MIHTWWNSYFAAPGLRVFLIVPDSLTESILPLSVTPAPSELVRVLVGRSEILEPEFERHLLAEATEDASLPRYFTDRYYSAYLSRVATLQGGPAPSDGEAVVEAGR